MIALHCLCLLTLAATLVACTPAAPNSTGPPKADPTSARSTPPKPAAASPSPSPSPSPPPLAEVTVRLAAGAIDAAQWPLLVAEQKGFFRTYAVRVQTTRSGPAPLDQLKAGQADVVVTLAESALLSAEQGTRLSLISGLLNKPAYSLIGARDVTVLGDLKGKPVAVGDPKSAQTILVKRVLAAAGLTEAEMRLVAFGAPETQVAAVANGTAAAVLVEQPLASQMVRQRFKSLSLASEAVPSYQADLIAARPEWLAAGDASARFLRALIEAETWLYDVRNKQEAATILTDATKGTAADSVGAYELLVEKAQAIPRNGEVNAAGVRAVVDFLIEADGLKRPGPDPARLIDTAALEKGRN